jgi:hypothetical protein
MIAAAPIPRAAPKARLRPRRPASAGVASAIAPTVTAVATAIPLSVVVCMGVLPPVLASAYPVQVLPGLICIFNKTYQCQMELERRMNKDSVEIIFQIWFFMP